MQSEKEHELAYMLVHGASKEMDWEKLFGEARAEVLRLRKQAPPYHSELQKLDKALAPFNLRARLTIEITAAGATYELEAMKDGCYMQSSGGRRTFEEASVDLLRAVREECATPS